MYAKPRNIAKRHRQMKVAKKSPVRLSVTKRPKGRTSLETTVSLRPLGLFVTDAISCATLRV